MSVAPAGWDGAGDPRVDVVVSGLDEERYLGRCLEHVLAQDYPAELLRVVFVDGGSADGTAEVAGAVARDDPRLTVVADGRRRNLPEALNLGLARCDAPLVAKVDAHGYPEPDFLRRAVEALREGGPRLACVGGRPLQEGETPWGEAVARARTSRFGTGGSVYAGSAPRELVDSVQCGVYRREALDSVGQFDPTMAFGEDDELNWRLRAAGYLILLDASMRFHYVTRPSLAGLFRQYRRYGAAKVRVGGRHPAFLRPWHVAPAGFVAVLATLGAASAFSSRARAAGLGLAGVYAGAATVAAAASTRRPDRAATARTAACFAAIHLGYGLGMLEGIARLARSPSRSGS